jgi:hypothetical protein
MSFLLSASVIAEAEVTNIGVIKNRPLCSRHLDIDYPLRMPFYLYSTGQEIHIDHILVKAPNAQLSAGEITFEFIEGSESEVAAGLEGGLIAVANTLPEHLMQPFTLDRLESFFRPCAKFELSIYPDEVAQSQGYGFCDKLGEPIARCRITLGGNTFVDEYMINLDVPVVVSQSPKKSMPGSFPDVTLSSQDHPLFRGYAPGERTGRESSTSSTHSWREVWDSALAGRQFTDVGSNPESENQTQKAMPRRWKHRAKTIPSVPFRKFEATDALAYWTG